MSVNICEILKGYIMKIHAAGALKNTYNTGFKSLRTDKKTVSFLENGKLPILENNKINIYGALAGLAKDPTRDNIEFLLSVADNLSYGQNGQSEFKRILDEEAVTPSERENTNWSKLLEDTLQRALNNYTGEDAGDLQYEFYKIFSQEKKLTPEQQKLLEQRKTLTDIIINEHAVKDEEHLERAVRVRENLDYFIASSEIPMNQKQYCLDKFIYLMSPDYKINKQLEDKKLQVLDEMLNDMLIKTPEDDVLTIKSVDQRQSGMCAAISICRKAMAYEDKERYTDLILDELSDSETMSVFDVTELGKGKKISVPKANIDYNTALAKGYRIIDASAHNWMQNAHAGGDGSIITENYIPFDDSYGVYNDSSWYEALEEPVAGIKSLLKALIKERELLSSLLRYKKLLKTSGQKLLTAKQNAVLLQSSINGKYNEIFGYVFPDMPDKEKSILIKSICNFCKGKNADNEKNIGEPLSNENKQQLLADFIIASVPECDDTSKTRLYEKISVIYGLADEYLKSEKEINALLSFNSPGGKYTYYKRLFNLAAAHRLAIEADVNLPDGVIRFEKASGLPPRNVQVLRYLKSLGLKLPSEALRQNLNKHEHKALSDSDIEKMLASDIIKIESVFPQQLNEIANSLLGKNINEIVTDTYNGIAGAIANGDEEVLENTKSIIGLENKSKQEVLEFLNNRIEKLSKLNSNQICADAIRMLGFEDTFHMLDIFISTFINSLQSGISEEQYKNLAKQFGGEDKIEASIAEQRAAYIRIKDEYSDILSKWSVPSARANILTALEKKNQIMPRRQLDYLKKCFNSIEAGTIKNESIYNVKERRKANEKFYKFDSEALSLFNKIEKSLSDIKKYSKVQYQNINKILFDELENQYSYIGMLNGQFWVREEGSSGLAASEQLRIIEQMTGKPYHIEYDINDAAKLIKEGNGSGIISMSVDDSDYAFHAMYVPSVTAETFTNNLTNEKIIKDILWMDNSWGRAEKDNYWRGTDGRYHTDYGNGYGWKNGFILSDKYTIGLPVDEIQGAIGVEKEDQEEFGLFTDMVLPGTPVNTYQRLYRMFNYILNINEGEQLLSALENSLSSGYKFNINELESLDLLAEAKTDRIAKRIKDEIKSRHDFDMLDDNDELKLAFKKLALYLSTDDRAFLDRVSLASDSKELEEIKQDIIQDHIDKFGGIIAKSDAVIDVIFLSSESEFKQLFKDLYDKFGISLTDDEKDRLINSIFINEEDIKNIDGSLASLTDYFDKQIINASENIEDEKASEFFTVTSKSIIRDVIDKNVRIKDLNSPVLANSPLQKEFIAAVDKYLNPHSDEELLQLIQGMQNADYDTVNGFIDALTPEDIGVKIKDPYDYVLKYKAGSSEVTRAFSEVVGTEEIYANLNTSSDDEDSTPEEIYRTLYIKLAEMDVQKYINAFKAEAFQKYKVRQAFPEPVVLSDEVISDTVNSFLLSLKEASDNIASADYVYKVLSSYEDFISKFSKNDIYKEFIKSHDVEITPENADTIKAMVSSLRNVYNITKMDASLNVLTVPAEKLIKLLENSSGYISGSHAGLYIKELSSAYQDMISSGSTKEKFVQMKKEELINMRKNISLFANCNVEPKYRDELLQKLYRYIKLFSNNAPQDKQDELANQIEDLIINKHIVKNPQILLKETINLLLQGKKDSNEYSVLRLYLTMALKVAQQTKIQYKLVQNQHSGITSKVKELLPLFNVLLSDGTTAEMDSDVGMLYLVEQLQNAGDNYITLKLFLEQTGLARKALGALLKNFDVNKACNLVDEKHDMIITSLSDAAKLQGLISEFFEKSKIKYKSLSDAISHLNAYIERKSKNYDSSDVFKKYSEYMKSVACSNSLDTISSSMINPLLQSVISDAFEYIMSDINNQLDSISDYEEMISRKYELFDSINVPEDCEEFVLRQKFFDDYENVIEYIRNKKQEILDYAKNLELIVDIS